MKQTLKAVGPGLVTQVVVNCDSCHGTGSIYKDKDKCKKCKGLRTTEERKNVEVYIPRGSKSVKTATLAITLLMPPRSGERIVLEGEADQSPDQTPGDIIFTLVEIDHDVFKRAGADLLCPLKISLVESLCGFSRVVVKHLDGRGIQLSHNQPKGKVLRPGQVLKVAGEGMPFKKSDIKGDLYLVVDVEFPEDGWLKDDKAVSKIQSILPKMTIPAVEADTVDEVEYEEGDLDDFGGADGEGGDAWEDEDEEGGQPQCTQQ